MQSSAQVLWRQSSKYERRQKYESKVGQRFYQVQ